MFLLKVRYKNKGDDTWYLDEEIPDIKSIEEVTNVITEIEEDIANNQQNANVVAFEVWCGTSVRERR